MDLLLSMNPILTPLRAECLVGFSNTPSTRMARQLAIPAVQGAAENLDLMLPLHQYIPSIPFTELHLVLRRSISSSSYVTPPASSSSLQLMLS